MLLEELVPVFIQRYPGILVIVEPRAPHFLVIELETEGFYQVEPGAGIGGQTDDISRIWGYFGLKKDDIDQILAIYINAVHIAFR